MDTIKKSRVFWSGLGKWQKRFTGCGIIVVVLLCCGLVSAIGQALGIIEPSPTKTPQPVAAVEKVEQLPTETLPPAPNVPTDTLAPTDTPAPTNTPEPTKTPVPSPTPDPNYIKAGTYLVGTDIQPGIYMGIAGTGFDSCYWARLKDFTGNLDAILANENSVGQFYIEIKETDYALDVQCDIYKLEDVLQPVSNFPLIKLEPGTYIVGRDIQAGTYKGTAGEGFESCYWARLSGLSGDFNELIANDNAEGQFYVEVVSSDFALTIACEIELVK